MGATVQRMRVNAPQLANPEIMGERIMDTIVALPKDSRRAEPSASLPSVARNDRSNPKWKPDRFAFFAFSNSSHTRRIRFGLAITAAMIVLVFFVQESMILSKISRLEKHMAAVPMHSAVTVPIRSGITLMPDEIKNVPGSAFSIAAIGEEWIAVRRTDIESLLRSVQNSRRFNALLLEIIQKHYPGIRSLDAEMSIDSEKVIRILRENPMIIRELLQSSETGGRT
jgi:hypothetical protein